MLDNQKDQSTREDDLYESMVGLFGKLLTEEEERSEFKRRLKKFMPEQQKVIISDLQYFKDGSLEVDNAIGQVVGLLKEKGLLND